MNIKKIGLTALAGSLVAFSASAVELSVSGKTEITYVSTDISTTGNPFGFGNEISFTGSGDVNGMTATYFATIGDQGQASSTNSETFASSSLMLDMGDMGTIGFDQGVGTFGVSTIDDKTPYAYEEQWSYTGGSAGLRADGGSKNVLGYKQTVSGVDINFEYSPGASTSNTGDAGTAGAGAEVKGYNYALTGTPTDGMTAGFGYGRTENGIAVAKEEDIRFKTGFVTYAMGAVTAGYQMSEGRGGLINAAENDVKIYGVSVSANENFAISYSMMDNKFSTAGSKTEKTSGLGASYTMGSAAVRMLMSQTDDVGGVENTDQEHVEVSLMLAF